MGEPPLHARYYQQIAPKVAIDQADNLSLTETAKTPAREFNNCPKMEKTTRLEPGTEYKYYAPGFGPVQDGSLRLVKHGKADELKK